MNILHITDLNDNHVQVSLQRGSEVPRPHKNRIPFENPLDDEGRAELRWYLEEFLSFPYAAQRSPTVYPAPRRDGK